MLRSGDEGSSLITKGIENTHELVLLLLEATFSTMLMPIWIVAIQSAEVTKHLGSGPIHQSQKMTSVAVEIAEKKLYRRGSGHERGSALTAQAHVWQSGRPCGPRPAPISPLVPGSDVAQLVCGGGPESVVRLKAGGPVTTVRQSGSGGGFRSPDLNNLFSSRHPSNSKIVC